MASGFGALCGQNLALHWIEAFFGEEISHSTILERMGWEENESTYIRFFVRIQVYSYDIEQFEFDEGTTLPGWVENNRQEIKDNTEKVLVRVAKIRDKYHASMHSLDKKLQDLNKTLYNDLADYLLIHQRKEKLISDLEEMKNKAIAEYSLIPGYTPDNRES